MLLVNPTLVTVPVGNVAKVKSPSITCDDVPAPAIFIVPDDVTGEPVIVRAVPVSVNPILVTEPLPDPPPPPPVLSVPFPPA